MSDVGAARSRVAEWVAAQLAAKDEKSAADAAADAQSLERAADLEAIYNTFEWVADMPPVVRTKARGRAPNPKSRDQFAKWVQQTYGWGTKSRLDQLQSAVELVPILSTAVEEIEPTSEWTLRPFSRLRNAGYTDQQGWVWQRAVELAGGECPTRAQVNKAVTTFINERKIAKRNVAADPRTAAEVKAARRAVFVKQFDDLMNTDNREAKEALNEMIRHFKAHQDVLKEEQQWA